MVFRQLNARTTSRNRAYQRFLDFYMVSELSDPWIMGPFDRLLHRLSFTNGRRLLGMGPNQRFLDFYLVSELSGPGIIGPLDSMCKHARSFAFSSCSSPTAPSLQCCTLGFLPETKRRTNATGHIEELPCVRSPKNPSLLQVWRFLDFYIFQKYQIRE
jgi:hypothetical protein